MKIRHLIIGIILFGALLNAAELPTNKINANTASKLQYTKKYLNSLNANLDIQQLKYPFSSYNNKLYVDLLLQVTNPDAESQLKYLGCEIITRTKTIFYIKAPVDAVEKIAALSSVSVIETARLYKPALDSSKKTINAANVTAVNTVPLNIIGGEGVLIGILDSGIDLDHPDFSNENGTRVLKLWDMSDTAKIGPGGYDNYKWGMKYTKSMIDEAPETVRHLDRIGHGTHVAGIAAGGGKADSKFRGIAYNSDLLLVKGNRDDNVGYLSDGDIIAGCDYLVKEAEKLNRPLVVNLSLGSTLGSHDGKSLISAAMSEMSKPGVVFAVAAGNDNYLPLHAGVTIDADTLLEFPIKPNNVCWLVENETNLCDSPNSFYTLADFWYSKDLIDSVYILAYDTLSQSAGEPILISYKSYPIGIQINNEAILNQEGEPIAMIEYNAAVTNYAANNSGNLKIEIHNNADTNIYIDKYLWSIVIKTKNKGRIDLWGSYPISSVRKFKPVWETYVLRADGAMTICAPGDADSAVCVASFITKNSWKDVNDTLQEFDWLIGDISDFSSRGPSRDGRILPLISAPGEVIFSAKSKDCFVDSTYMFSGGKYVGHAGTSLAAPHLTGCIALMLQVKPDLGYSDIVKILENTAVRDVYTGWERNNTFGLGKIDLQAAINYILTQVPANNK